ncbi:DUF4926 domain-containing protein [Spirosoma spitsbergense]|jgi:hypothetical protein|uniref:DUF4926 domain-containing protein n=1 Tax=Spirosoma spitsbergense TaxID=431554 RepID=UPI000382E183|nr:DUF4926 domain-containing protein [Spirosoma spitsbergense]
MSEFDLVVLTEDLVNSRLKAGDVGTILTVYGEDKAFEVEFATLTGESVAVETLLPHQIREIRPSEMMAVRDMTLQEPADS